MFFSWCWAPRLALKRGFPCHIEWFEEPFRESWELAWGLGRPGFGLGRPPWAGIWVHLGACGGHLADLEGHVGAKRPDKSQDEHPDAEKLQQ